MSRECPHCRGTGTVPEKLTLECIGCQSKVVVTYTTTAEALEKCERVFCAECKKAGAKP